MMLKLQEIDFDPPPKSTSSRSSERSSNNNSITRYDDDIRPQQHHHSSFISENSSNSSDRDYVGSSLHSSFLSAIKAEVNSNHEDEEDGDEDDQEVVQEEDNREQVPSASSNDNDGGGEEYIADWSNGPAILESSDRIINDNSTNNSNNRGMGDLPQSKDVTKETINMSPSADSVDITTSNEDDYDENNSVFLSWPENTADEEQIDRQQQNHHNPQHQQNSNKDDESITSERSWWRGWNGNRKKSAPASTSSSIADDDDQHNVVITITKKRGSAPKPQQRHSSISDVSDNSNHSNSNNDDNNKCKSNRPAADDDDDDLEETLQSHYNQWWKFGIQRRGTVEPSESSFHNSSIAEEEASNKNNAANAATGNDDDDDMDETLQSHYNQWWQFGVRRRGTVEPSIISSVAEEEEDESTRSSTVMINRSGRNYNSTGPETNLATSKQINRRRSIESNKSDITSSAVDDTELNNFLFPRRGWANRQNSIRGSVIGGSDTASVARTAATTASKSPRNRPQCQNHESTSNSVEDIVERLSKNFVNVSPIERALLNDMASTKNLNRWRNNRSSVVMSSADVLDDDHQRERRGDDGEVGDNGLEQQPSSSTEDDEKYSPSNAKQDNPEIYWDSDKLCRLKRDQGVSLARARALDDEVSSIASSEHSGRIPLMKNIAHKRSTFTFGWNNATPISEEEDDINDDDGNDDGDDTPDDNSFKVEKIFPRSAANSGRLTSSRGSGRLSMSGGSGRLSMTGGRFASSGRLTSLSSSIRPKSIISTSKGFSSKPSRKYVEYDDYDDETCDLRATEDLKRETVVKEACEIMTSVNNSVIAMGMNAVFRPMEEICPPFHKLHKNLGYQMDALGATIVRSKKSLVSDKRSELKKSKKLRASKMKNSFSPRASMGLNDITMSTRGGMHDPEAMSKLIAQMILMQSQQNSDAGSSSSNSNVTQHSFFTSWLPNYMWYQSIAADVMRPTSLCSGTGITGSENYLNPEMLKVFQMFSTYFVGSKHLFQEGDEDNKKSKVRRHWMETIDEEDSDDDMSESSSSFDSEDSDESDMVYELDDASVDVDGLVDTEKQIEILQNVIKDLRKSQMNDAHPLLSIDTHTLDDTKPSTRGQDNKMAYH